LAERLWLLRLSFEDCRQYLVESGHQYNWVMDAAADTPAPIAILLENHRAFLRYLERRVGDRAVAENILQEAFANVVARSELEQPRRLSSPGSTGHCVMPPLTSFVGADPPTARTRRSPRRA
jgi:hypothetical protein